LHEIPGCHHARVAPDFNPPFFRTFVRPAGLALCLLPPPSPISDPAGADAALREISRALRRICLLQETGRDEEASQLEPVLLDPLVQSFREFHGADSLPEEQIRALRASEHERAGDAVALGELLAPLLLEQLRRAPDPLRSHHASSTPRPTSDLPRRPAIAPDIADLLDGMLAQENEQPARRPRLRP
jgi:hypothetical protein